MLPSWYIPGSKAGYASFTRLPLRNDWFEAYQISPHLVVFYEPRHYEETIANLVIGDHTAALIDTGCGIGPIHDAVREVTDRPILVINTHTHTDHIAGNRSFDRIAALDHPRTRHVASAGVAHDDFHRDLLTEGLVAGAWPRGFDPSQAVVPPFQVALWLRDGDRVDLGGRDLEVLHTPGEALDHICLLDRADRVLFSGDILLEGPVWTHLEGGSVTDLVASYERLMNHVDDFDRLMPSHNIPWLDKSILPEALAGARGIVSGEAPFTEESDPWQRQLRRFSFERIQILTSVA